jgi:threonine dehydratase
MLPMDASLADLRAAADLVHQVVAPTPLHAWPLLSARAGAQVRLKHENDGPVGAFKIRGGLVYMDRLQREKPGIPGFVAATRGNHGQSVAFAARRAGLPATIVVPHGNSREKNRAMRALGAELIEHGHDFQSALDHAKQLAATHGLHFFPSIHPWLVLGVASYALEMFDEAPELDAVYVPIGMGSGICGVIAARDALGLKTEVVGVVAEGAPAYALSFEAGRVISTERADTFVDGVACRHPDAWALECIFRGAARIVRVSDAGVRAAMRAIFQDTHNLCEPAGATGVAALLQERDRVAGRKVAAILSGSNVDKDIFARVLTESDDPASTA